MTSQNKRIFSLIFSSIFFVQIGIAEDTICTQKCYDTKSAEYQKCRAISAKDRGARSACFKAADQSLERCLKHCS